MTKEELERLETLCAAATPGPWELVHETWIVRLPIEEGRRHPDVATAYGVVENGTFIAAAREALPALLAEVQRLTAERDAAVAQCRAWKEKLAAALADVAKLVPVADAEAVAAERERCALVCEAAAAEWAQAAAEATDPVCRERFAARATQARDDAAAIRRGGV